MLRCLWLLLLLPVHLVDAALQNLERSVQLHALQPGPEKKVFANTGDTVCGGSAVRKFLITPETATEVRNIPWSQVEAIADDYLRTQTQLVEGLQADVDRLKVEIPARAKAEAVQPLTSQVLQSAVTASMSAPGSYGSLQFAKDTKCGEERNVRPRPTWRSSEAKVAATRSFEASIKDALRPGNLAVVGQTVRTECERLLGVPAGSGMDYCRELCQGFADAGTAASTAALAVSSKVDELRNQLEQMTALLRKAVMEYDQCKQLKADLSIFRRQLEGLAGNVKDTHSKLMDAQEALMDAQYNLDDAEQALQAQTGVAGRAAELLQGAGREADAASAKFEAAGAQMAAADKSIKASEAELQRAQLDLKKAQGAADAVTGLKAAVSDSMLKMVLYFDEAIRVPIRDLGLGERVEVDSLFPRSPSTLESAGACEKSISALSGFCALPGTQTVLARRVRGADGLDPRELCAVGDVPQLQRELNAAVADRVNSLKESLKEVQSWLCAYRGQTEEEVAAIPQYLKQGEPVGLREVISTFGKTPYYRRYLQHWKFRGKFLELYASLHAALEQAKVTHSSATTKLQGAAQQLKQAEAEMAAAQSALQQMLQNKSLAQSKHVEAQALLSSMTADKERMQRNLAELEAALREAERRWQQAQLTLQQTHREGVSLVQLLEEMEGSWDA